LIDSFASDSLRRVPCENVFGVRRGMRVAIHFDLTTAGTRQIVLKRDAELLLKICSVGVITACKADF